jgi:hypothetical protein
MGVIFLAVVAANPKLANLRTAIAAAYRRAARMLRYCHPRLLDAPTLLAPRRRGNRMMGTLLRSLTAAYGTKQTYRAKFAMSAFGRILLQKSVVSHGWGHSLSFDHWLCFPFRGN